MHRLFQVLIERKREVEKKRVGVEVDLVSALAHESRNVLGYLKSSEVDVCCILH